MIQVQDREKRCRQKTGSKRRMTNLYLTYPSFLKNCVPEWSLACPAPPSLDQYTVSQWASPIPESHVYQSTTSTIIPLHKSFSKENHLNPKKICLVNSNIIFALFILGKLLKKDLLHFLRILSILPVASKQFVCYFPLILSSLSTSIIPIPFHFT